MSRWAVRKGYRSTPFIGDDSDVIRRRKEAQRASALGAGRGGTPAASSRTTPPGPHHCGSRDLLSQGELLKLHWCDVSLARGEIVIRAEHTKDREKRVLPVSSRLRKLLEVRRDSPDGSPLPPATYVFGDEIGRRVGSVKRAWQTAVLRAHGHKPVWIWKRKQCPNDKGTTKLSPESQAAYRAINLHFHDLRHEGGSRLLEAGWPVHHVQHMLGHASLEQTSTYLNATLRGLHESMRVLEKSRSACKPLANTSARGPRPVRKQTPAMSGKSFCH